MIEGWFDFEDVYDLAIKVVEVYDEKISFLVEVGAFLGKSTVYLGQKLKESGKKGRIFAVDTWEGTPGETEHERIKTEVGDLFTAFKNNLIEYGVDDVVSPVKMSSYEAAKEFAHRGVDFVFLDAAHDYESVYEDMTLWWPKVDKLMAGHDFHPSWPGVVGAVVDFCEDNGLIYETMGNCWLIWRGENGLE